MALPLASKRGWTARLRLRNVRTEALGERSVFVDQFGRPVPAAHVEMADELAWVQTVPTAGLLLVTAPLLLGPVGALASASYVGSIAYRSWRSKCLKRAFAWVASGELERASAIVQDTRRAALLPPQLRIAAEFLGGVIAVLEDDPRRASELFERIRRAECKESPIYWYLACYFECICRINLEQLGYVEQIYNAMPQRRNGPWIVMQRLCADLYLQFARGSCVLPDETLAQALALACGRSVGPELLALTIWAYAERGDVDEARAWLPLLASRWNRAAQLRFPWLARWLDAWARMHGCPEVLSDAGQDRCIALSLPIAF